MYHILIHLLLQSFLLRSACISLVNRIFAIEAGDLLDSVKYTLLYIAVGYGTLYGDLCGSLSVLGDVYKTDVYKLSRYMNRNGELIPENTLTKAPSAELRPGQKDQDSLPDYDTLDATVIQFTLCGAPFGFGEFRRLRAATIGAARPPRPPRQSSRALQPHFWIGDFLLFGKENKVGSWRSRLSTRRLIPRFS